jgi:hypothetical protein
MSFEEVRAAAIDRALIGDDPEPALALAGVVDAVDDDTADADPLAAALLTVGALATEHDRPLDERAWTPGGDADPFVVAGAAVAVRSRGLSLDRAAELADCSRAALDDLIDDRTEE